jgi:hypothetical protein
MLRPAYLRQKLTRPLPTKDGGVLWTVADARAYMLALSQERLLRQHWQDACRILDQADVAAFSRKVELALFLDHKLELAYA